MQEILVEYAKHCGAPPARLGGYASNARIAPKSNPITIESRGCFMQTGGDCTVLYVSYRSKDAVTNSGKMNVNQIDTSDWLEVDSPASRRFC